MFFRIILEFLVCTILFIFGAASGFSFGFKDGVNSVEFDKERANNQLQQCLGIISQ